MLTRRVLRPPKGEMREWRVKSEGSKAMLRSFLVKANL